MILRTDNHQFMNDINYKILTLIQFFIPVYLLIGFLDIPFWYYESVRWTILIVCLYIAIVSIRNDFLVNFILMLGLIFLFRPIYPFILEGLMWIAFNISAIIIISITILYLKEEYKRKSELKLPDLLNNLERSID